MAFQDGSGSRQSQVFGVPRAEFTPSEVWLTNGVGHGSAANNKIRVYTTVRSYFGDSLRLIQNLVDGDSILVVKPGVYAMTAMDVISAGDVRVGISRNATPAEMATSIAGVDAPACLIQAASSAASYEISVHVAGTWCNAGDILRCHTAGANNGVTSNNSSFRVCKVA